MIFYIADTFQSALAKLDNQSQKAAKICALDLQMDPTGKGKQFHRIDRSKEKNFWSVRANRDVRIIVHKTSDRFTLCYVDHHDAAYDWAERRVFETHPTTGALQIVELVERVEEVQVPAPAMSTEPIAARPPRTAPQLRLPLADVSKDELLSYGVPPRWIDPLKEATEERALELSDHLPAEASEAILALLIGEKPMMLVVADRAPADEQRRFRVVEHVEELERALEYPWEKWTVFLHPSQRRFVEADYSGPARVAGSAGTGKTVVAVHRALKLSKQPGANVLLTTFSRPLASALQTKVNILNGDDKSVAPNIHVASFIEAARGLFELNTGQRPHIVRDEFITKSLMEIAPDEEQSFLNSEWREVIDPWQISSLDEYADISRTGRRSRISKGQRERFWPIFEAFRKRLSDRRQYTEAMVFDAVTESYQACERKPYTHVVVDEAQDLGVPELRFLAAIAETNADSLFFAGDLGQRIFKLPYSWKALGIDVRGRSGTLTVNYRTSHQVRTAADKLLPAKIADMDGVEQARASTISVFNGPMPDIYVASSVDEEIAKLGDWVKQQVEAGLAPREIGLIARTDELLERARRACSMAGQSTQTLTEALTLNERAIAIGTMHLAKGLEFRAVAVLGCDDEFMPLQSRLAEVATEDALEEVYTTERHLLYVACTRAREQLLLTGVQPVSEFFADLQSPS